jgi:copper chaperone CopZ
MKKILAIMICAMFTIGLASAQEAKKKSNAVTTRFFVESMECEHCVDKIKKNLSFEKGVTDLKCDLKTQTVEVTYRSDKTNEENLLAAFKKIDKPAVVVKDKAKAKP